MTTVVDEANPWLMPRITLAATIQLQAGLTMSSTGTGMAISQPATSTGFRPYGSDRVPTK